MSILDITDLVVSRYEDGVTAVTAEMSKGTGLSWPKPAENGVIPTQLVALEVLHIHFRPHMVARRSSAWDYAGLSEVWNSPC